MSKRNLALAGATFVSLIYGVTFTIAKVLKKPLFMPNIPKFIMKLILGEMHELLFENRNLSAKKIIDKGFVFKYKTIDEALKNILT